LDLPHVLKVWQPIPRCLSPIIDVALRITHLNDSSLVARHVGTVRRVFVASPGHTRNARPAAPRANFPQIFALPRLPALDVLERAP
jgi:DNA-binding transcriptional LysR family regulator